MTVSFVSTPYLSTSLLAAIGKTQAQLTNLGVEATTGEYADLGQQLGSQCGYELSLRNTEGVLQAITNANAVVSGSLSTATTALSSISSKAQSVAQALTAWSPGGAESTGELVDQGNVGLQNLVSLGNASYAGNYVFGGIASQTAPLATFSSTSSAYQAVAAAFQTNFGCLPTSAAVSTITGAQLQTFLSGTFASLFTGASWTTNWSSASSVDTSSEILPGETVTTSTNANTTGFQQLAQAYTMLSMFGGSSFGAGAQQAVVTSAMSLLSSGMAGIASASTAIGESQSAVTQANSDMSSQMTLVQTQIGGLDNVDQNRVATELSSLTTQLETAYQLTAQLQKLNLAQYLPA